MSIMFHDWRAMPLPSNVHRPHVYVASLADLTEPASELTPEEWARAQRFRLMRVREQFIATRALLRRILGHYLGLPAASVPILVADGGKPYLPEELGLHFNVSHTDGVALVAVSNRPIGVDIERSRPVPDADALVTRFFSPIEVDRYSNLPAEHRPAAFLRAWVRKEAILKGIGRGVRSLDCCTVTFLENEPPRLVWLADDDDAPRRWKMVAWQPAPGLEAALAYQDDE